MFVRDSGGVLLHRALTMALSVVGTINREMYQPIVKDILQSSRHPQRPDQKLFVCMFDGR
ncbi:hypothetical protein BFL43_15835 [Williamsia sp. 1135]|nr:hypothetical protein BFL43_15835 [Williamsia sp. 1135]